MEYKVYRTKEEDGVKLLYLESNILGFDWVSGGYSEQELEEKGLDHFIVAWKLKDFRSKPKYRMDLAFYKGKLSFLEWYWGEDHFWDAGRQGGHATWFPAEMLTLSDAGDNAMIDDLWLGRAGFFHQQKENIPELVTTLMSKAVEAYIMDSSPAEAVGYPGKDWPTTLHPKYTRGYGPARSQVDDPDRFVAERQQPGHGILVPMNPMG